MAKKLLRKFYKSIDDNGLDHRNVVDTRDAFDNAIEQSIRMDVYVQKLDKIDKNTTKEILNYIKNINDYMQNVDISKTVNKQFNYTEEQHDMIKSAMTGGFNITTTVNTIKQML